MKSETRDRMRRGIPLIHLVLLAAAALPYFVHLGTSSLWDANESFYAETPREMLQTGDFLAPKFNSQTRAQKPPLTYWAIAFCYRVFGVDEFSVRLPGALAATGVLFFVYLAGRLLFSPAAGLIALLLTGASMQILLIARKLPVDILLLFFLVGTGYFLMRGIVRNSTWSWLAAYALAALGTLTKGPIAVLIPAGSCVVWALWSRRLGFRQVRFLAGFAVFCAIVLPWYVLIYRHSGWEYIAPFLLRDNLGRFAGERLGPARGSFYYTGVYAAEFFPWSVLSVAALVHLWRIRDSVDLRRGLAWGFPLAWSLLVFLFFSASANKQEHYIAPLYPMMALILAGMLDRGLTPADGAEARLWCRIWNPALIFIAIVFFCCGLLLPFLIVATIPGIPAVLQYGPSFLFLFYAGALMWSIRRGRPAESVLVLLASWWLVVLALPALYLPAAERFHPVRGMCADLQPLLSPEDEVGYYREAAPSMLFYLRRPIFEEWKAEKMVRMFQSPKRVFCLMARSDLDYFVGEKELVLYLVDRRPQLGLRLRDLTDRRSRRQRDLVLVSNHPVDSELAAARRRESP
jgi:4-amino-4-deoxy-L-arabinose transferase-like glycosyltransferase